MSREIEKDPTEKSSFFVLQVLIQAECKLFFLGLLQDDNWFDILSFPYQTC